MNAIRTSAITAALLTAVMTCSAVAQDLQLPGLDGGFGFGDPAGDTQVTFWADYQVDRASGIAEISVHAQVIDGWHIFSTTQPSGGPVTSVLKLAAPAGAKQVREWESNVDPERHFDDQIFMMEIEEHRGEVVWTASFELPADFDFENTQPQISFTGQTCTDGLGQCIELNETIAAEFIGYVERQAAVTEYTPAAAHVKFKGSISPQKTEAGQIVQLVIVAEPLDGYHLYSRKNEKTKGSISAPTLIALTKRNGWAVGVPAASQPPKREETGLSSEPIMEIHEKTVSWSIEVEIPEDTEPGDYRIEGLIGFQTCNESSCDLPLAAAFKGTLTVGDSTDSGEQPLAFESYDVKDGDAYSSVADLAQKMEWGLEGNQDREPVTAGKYISWMFTAFLAGLILNVMPCVLPVIGLKIMSLVSQAGAHRFQIFYLNLWLAIGMLFVFLTLATLAVVFGMAWGEQFTNHWFTIGLISVVFIFGLSFLGVWEVPIPGFAGSMEVNKLTEREGAIGAFFKGVLSTVLATPCAGPLLVPAVAWAVSQPPVVTYSMFAAMGLGMASPYLVIGLFPSAIKWLPKPGNWMVTFKEIMGFIMMGTAVWLFYTLSADYRVPMAAFAVFLGFFCWWIGRIPAGSERHHTIKGWSFALTVVAIGGWFSLALLGPGESKHELEWQPFDRVAIQDHVDKGATVFVDFTGDS